MLYLAFNAGYSDVAFNDVADSAISLAEAVVDLMPLESEACGLLALMLMQNSRRSARLSSSGELLTLEEQDRSLWNRSEIDRGCAMLAPRESGAPTCCRRRSRNAMQSRNPRHRRTGHESSRSTTISSPSSPSPVISLNRAIAVGMRDGPDAGLALLDAVTEQLDGFHLLPAAQADLLSLRRPHPRCSRPL